MLLSRGKYNQLYSEHRDKILGKSSHLGIVADPRNGNIHILQYDRKHVSFVCVSMCLFLFFEI